MIKLPVFAITAYSGTGKTTMLEKLILELKQRGLRVAAIKHDGHDFEFDREGKDSWRLTKAGADTTILVSRSQSVFMENRPVSIERILQRIDNVDLVLIEGWKDGPWPKIMLHRKETGQPLPLDPDDCLAIMTDEPIRTMRPCFTLDDIQSVADLLQQTTPLLSSERHYA